MSGISSGIGLISGIDSASLIDQLIEIERQPVKRLQGRVETIDAQRAAFLELSARLLSVQNSVLGFGRSSFFNNFTSASTNDKVLTAKAGSSAVPGTYTFRVRSLVTNHSVVSRGFADADTTPVGVGSLSIEMGAGRIDKSTELSMLNGGNGVRRGVITITDRSGASADIDLSMALTIDDVLDAINTDTAINVRASVTGAAAAGAEGDRIIIEDLNAEGSDGGALGNLSIVDKSGGWAAADLGIVANVAADRIDGRDLVRLSTSTPLSMLNDGNGVGRFKAGADLQFTTTFGDFGVSLTSNLATQLDTDLRILNSGQGVRLGTIRLTDRAGVSAEVDLSDARTVRDVIDAINAADTAVGATVIQINDESFFQFSDESGISEESAGAAKMKIEDVTGFAAADLGIAQEVEGVAIQGGDVYRIETIGDVINAINYASGNNSLVEADISEDGNGLVLRAQGLGNTVTVAAALNADGDASTAARDLGILDATLSQNTPYHSRRLISGLDTVLLSSLNGGRGVGTGDVLLADRTGRSATVDLSQAQTLQDVIDLINLDEATSIVASVNSASNGVLLRDDSGGSEDIVVEDVTGTLATDLGLAGRYGVADGDAVDGGNLQLQYVSLQTLLSDLNGGGGVSPGSFRITDSGGNVYVVELSDIVKTVGDVVDAINRTTPDTIEARINDTGDGIVVIDTAGGESPLTIEDDEGDRAAADLRLSGTAAAGENLIDGSFETRIAIDADDTLESIAEKINNAGIDVAASVLNHGSVVNPYSLTLTSEVSGRRGELTLDTVGVDLGFTTLSAAQDAVITIGDDTTSQPLLICSSTNTVEDVVPGVTLNLLAADDDPVTLTIAQNVDGIVETINTFVSAYNDVIGTIDSSTSFNPDTLERGILFGDSTVNRIRNRLLRVMMRQVEGVGAGISHPFSVGLRTGEGGRLTFDEDRFRTALDESPELLERFFTEEDTGFAAILEDMLDELTRDFDGMISQKNEALTDQQELLNNRIDDLNILIEAKRARLEAQFIGLESSLASLQAQQASLGVLANLT